MPFEIRRYYTLGPARDALRRERGVSPYRLWAEDCAIVEGRRPGSKSYLVASVFDVFYYCMQQKKPRIYEIIDHEAFHLLYFDTDRSTRKEAPPATLRVDSEEFMLVNSSAITRDDVDHAIAFVRSVMIDFLALAFGLPANTPLKIMSGSSAVKLSLHIVVPSVLLDFSQTSTASVSWEFANFLEKAVWTRSGLEGTSPGEHRVLLRIVNIDPEAPSKGSFVDNAVDTASQCFRCLGCWKEDKYPLAFVDDHDLAEPVRFHYTSPWDLRSLAGDIYTFSSSSVNPVTILARARTVRLGTTFPFRSAFRLELARNPELADNESWVNLTTKDDLSCNDVKQRLLDTDYESSNSALHTPEIPNQRKGKSKGMKSKKNSNKVQNSPIQRTCFRKHHPTSPRNHFWLECPQRVAMKINRSRKSSHHAERAHMTMETPSASNKNISLDTCATSHTCPYIERFNNLQFCTGPVTTSSSEGMKARGKGLVILFGQLGD
ncbi:hypothetical protein K3495_g14375 [Podosphaera aphanis]|nr:hypothetical protein K3495_g14375 [Podosphaera aphanis]